MKKLILLVLMGFLAVSSYGIPIIEVTKQCGGVFGYNYVHWERQVIENHEDGHSSYGWVGDCNGRGFKGCRPPMALSLLNSLVTDTEADQYDQTVAEDIMEDIESNMSSSNLNGTTTQTFQVSGQNFVRVYTVTWSAHPVECINEEGNPTTSFLTTFVCSVNYVAI